MQNRDYKKFAAHEIYHVYNRGNNKEKIFLDRQDYSAFIFRLGLVLGFSPKELAESELLYFPKSRVRINSKPNLFKLHSFCLMPNHFHLLIEQCTDTPISNLILKLCTSFSMYFNKKYKRVGNVFQDCFKAVNVKTNPQLMWNSAYIHMNPVVSKMISDPIDYEWSSYRDFMDNRKLIITSQDLIPEIFTNKKRLDIETKNLVKNNSVSDILLDTVD